MIITVDLGHCLSGGDIGASGYLVETNVNRGYGPLVIAGLRKLGHTVYDVTPVQTGLTLAQSLAYRVNMANYYKSDLHLCLHVNAFATDQAQGCEVEYISDSAKVYADKVCAEIAMLGFSNRGSNQRKDLYVLKYTNAVAILVEPFFCDTKTDCNKYNAQTLANAIIKGITGQDVYLDATPVAVKPVVVKYDETIPTGTNIFNIPGTKGYVEDPKDGRIIFHMDKGNYVTIGKGFIDAYWNDNNGHSGSKRISD